MRKIRVLIVDDSVVARRMLSYLLASDPSLEVSGTAANGRIALNKLKDVGADVVILDHEMPVMNGLQTLEAIRKDDAMLPVIMFSVATRRGAEITLDALSLGANDYVTKPANARDPNAAADHVRRLLIPKIKTFCAKSEPGKTPKLPGRPAKSGHHRAPVLRPQEVQVIAIGVSTGGPKALEMVLGELPKDFPVPILIAQHMPPFFTKVLAERLNKICNLQVKEGVEGDRIGPGCVWLAPGNYHMEVVKKESWFAITTNQKAQQNYCRPSVDILFRSVAEAYGGGVLAVMLTGMGKDGVRESHYVRERGGQIVVQDEATSIVWGMPGFVATAGLANEILPLNQISMALRRRVRKKHTTRDSAKQA